ncbi:MAG: hypothetical protein HYR96_15075 [Deltaproteobacteria bacterium]|nr:hypothetical protein [Deltaproteobacteria bacterium]MBI3295553.1 hypothetical protein [Deltaproteobacteria bacterium]
MENSLHSHALAGINRKILAEGESLPAVKLKDGTSVQTGTVATMLHNLERYNLGERGEIERELMFAVPTLFKIGLFDLFPPEEWLKGSNTGRQFLGRCALKHLRNELL